MAKEAKTIVVKNADGKEIEVTEKAYEVVYRGLGYKAVDASQESENDPGENPDNEEDYFQLSAEELKKVTNEKLKAFLDQEEIDYPSNANKDDLIALITGE